MNLFGLVTKLGASNWAFNNISSKTPWSPLAPNPLSIALWAIISIALFSMINSIPSLAIGFDQPEGDLMSQKPNDKN